MTNAPDIFLSYNREDQVTAQRFAQAFEEQGFSVWWDVTLRSGEAYDQVTEVALKSAKAVVVLWSKKSVVSRWVRAEATIADRNRTLVPARIEACDLPIMFELTQTADLSHWTGKVNHAAWRTFLADVRRFVDAVAAPTHAATPDIPAVSPRSPRETRPSIAVLPFINRSGLSEDDVFADGMVEDLTTALSVSRRMKVIASSATAIYRKGVRDLRQIGRDIGVRYLLEGNVRRVGGDLRVTAQLVEADNGDILWTQKFDRPLAELAALQEELVTEVAACLGVEVLRAEIEVALRKPGDITAWEAVLRADANMSRQTLSGYEAAVAEARRATEIDADYDLAHATLGLTLGLVFASRGGDDPALAQEVFTAVTRACALDSSDPIVLARIATALGILGRPRDGLRFAERAVTANPNLEVPRISLGTILMALGRWDEGIAETEAAMRLAPNGIWFSASLYGQSIAHFHAGRFQHALELSEQVIRLNSHVPSQIHKVMCLAKLGRREEAQEAMCVLHDSNSELSFPLVERYVRNILYKGSSLAALDEYVAIVRKLWDDAAVETKSP